MRICNIAFCVLFLPLQTGVVFSILKFCFISHKEFNVVLFKVTCKSVRAGFQLLLLMLYIPNFPMQYMHGTCRRK